MEGSPVVSLRCCSTSASPITPQLYVGGYAFEKTFISLVDPPITHVLQVGSELAPSHDDGDMTYMHIAMTDYEWDDLVVHLPRALSFIGDAVDSGGRVLVHCMMGISRSAAVAIAYLMWKERISFPQAAQQVYAARPVISPNPGFVLQLREWERAGMDTSAWKGWSRQRFLEALEEAGGLAGCLFDNVMPQEGMPLHTTAATQAAVVEPPAAAPHRPPMPTKLIHRLGCCIS